jgi:GntR family transcriptional regulator
MVRAWLALDHGSSVAVIDAVIYQDDAPIGTSVGYVGLTPEQAERFPNQNRGMVSFLEESLEVALGDAETRMATVSCDAETARRLGIDEGAAMLWLEDFIRDVDGRPRAIKQTRYRGDRVAFSAIARRRAAG